MKKYWIKDLNENQVIHAPTEEIAKKLCNRFNELGLTWEGGDAYTHWSFSEIYTKGGGLCYRPKTGKQCNRDYYLKNRLEILTIDQLLDFQANEYPKVMEVSDDGDSWFKRVVFMEKNGMFLAWSFAETIEEAENTAVAYTWGFAREIQPTPTLELTIDQIAEKFNVSPEQIKIKK